MEVTYENVLKFIKSYVEAANFTCLMAVPMCSNRESVSYAYGFRDCSKTLLNKFYEVFGNERSS